MRYYKWMDFDLPEKVFTVAEYIELLNVFFRVQEAKLTGEVCELKRAASGHCYFTIKDKTDAGVLDCILWKRNYEISGIDLEVGMEVILTGHANIYPPSGRFSFVADTIELVGEGALKKAYDALKAKLEKEGVFAPERKRALPEYAQKIGVVTSTKGAVIHDFQNNLGRFGFVVNVLDSRVEGQQAVKPLLAALAQMKKEAEAKNIEVLVIIRGGGSLESLQAFNNETLVRAIVDFPVPVIAGIGHDQDIPLAALAADYMTSTPTAAAHLISRSWEEAYAKIQSVGYILVRVQQEIKRVASDLELALASVFDHTERGIKWGAEQIDYAERFVRTNDPTRQLKLGYSIVRANGKVLKSVRSVAKNDQLEVQVSDGMIGTRVEKI